MAYYKYNTEIISNAFITLEQLTEKERLDLLNLSFNVMELGENSSSWSQLIGDNRVTVYRAFLARLKSIGICIPTSVWSKQLIIQPHYLLALLIRTRQISEDKLIYLIPPLTYGEATYLKFIRKIHSFLVDPSNEEEFKIAQADVDDEQCFNLLTLFPFFPELKEFHRGAPMRIQKRLLSFYLYQASEFSLKVDLNWLKTEYWNNPVYPDADRIEMRTMALLYDSVYHLNEADLLEPLVPTRFSTRFAQALFLQLRGNYTEAIWLYEEGMKGMPSLEKKPLLPNHPFYRFTYALALLREESAKSRKKLTALLKKREVREEDDNYPVYLITLVAEGVQPDEYLIRRGENNDTLSDLVRILAALILENYQLWSKPWKDYMELIQRMLIPERLLFWKECARIFPFIQKDPTLTERQHELMPLLPVYVKKEPWEEILTEILERDKSKKVSSEQIADARIVYMIQKGYYRIDITPMLQKRKANGGWTNGRRIAMEAFYYGMEEMTDQDKRIAKTIERRATYRGSYDYYFKLGEAMSELAGNPNVFGEEPPHYPIEIIKEKPYLAINKTEKGFRIESNVGDLQQESLIQVIEESELRYRVVTMTNRQYSFLKKLLEVEDYPVEAEPLLRACLDTLSKELTIHSELTSQSEQFLKKESDSRPVIQFMTLGEQFKAELFVKPLGYTSTYCKAGEGPHVVMATIEDKKYEAIRNFEVERIQAENIVSLFQDIDPDAYDLVIIPDSEPCLELLEKLHLLGDQVVVEWPEGVKFEVRQQVGMSRFNIATRAHNNWFEITGELQINEKTTIQIKELIDQMDKKQTRFIQLDGIGFVSLTAQLRNHLLELQQLTRKEKEKLLIPALAAPTLLSIEKEGGKVSKDTAFKKLMAHLEKAAATHYALPQNLLADLREYQEQGYQWMSRLADWGAGACLADDMGLGKTVQTIAMLLQRATKGSALVVAPASVISNWESELMRFAPSLTIKTLNRYTAERKSVIENAGAFDVVLLTYGLLITECDNLTCREWSTLVLDEAHTIKNRDTKMSKAAMQLKGDFRIILTGTPIQNHLNEVWNLFQFINPGLLGSYENFNDRFIIPIEVRQERSKQRFLKKLLSPFILRRTKTEVLNELPGKTEIIQPVELTEAEMAFYEALRRKAEMTLEKGDLNAIQTLAEITKLRQAACHTALVNPSYKGASSKTDEFMRLAEQLINNNHRALVFSQFTSHLALIRRSLEQAHIDYLYLDGSTPTTKRSELVREFQTGSCPLFLISLKAGGLGLNLTGADYIFHLDPWWNPAVEDQASDRAYRIGQTRPVTVYRLIAKHTIEEKIIELHQTKKALADSLLEGNNVAKSMTREDLLALLREF